MKYQIGETQQPCSVGNIPDRETQQSCCVKNENREIQYSENGIEIATEDAVGNHVANGVAVTQRSSTTSELLGGRLFMLCEVMVLASIMVVIVGLFLIPTIYYALPESTTVKMENGTSVSNRNCSQVSEYSGEVCRDELVSLQMCFSGVTSPLNIPSSIDQQTRENDTMSLVNGLSFLNLSQQCSEAIMPFLCLSIFSLCDSSNTLHTILRQDCLDIRDGVCDSLWSQAVGFLGDGVLPVCEDLPDVIEDCTALSNVTNNISDFDNQFMPATDNQNPRRLVCSEGFFFDENGTQLCRPICGEFNRLPRSAQIVEQVFFPISFIASITLFVLALTVQRDSLLAFPSILFVYQGVTSFCLSGIGIVGGLDNSALFCKSRDWLVSIGRGSETLFCTISGLANSYFLEQVCVWIFLHGIFLFWAVVFPFNYRHLRISGRIRYAHIISVVLAVVVPLPAALVHLKDGHIAFISPTLLCRGRNEDYAYYTFVLPVSIIMCITSCLLVVIIWTIFKEFVLKKVLARKKVGNVRKAEIKVTAIIIYYVLLGVMGLVAFTYFMRLNADAISQYIVCQSSGKESCQEEFSISKNDIFFMAAPIVMVSLLPVVAILFSCDPKAFKTKFQVITTHLKSQTSKI